jgi:hypothetical protein
MTPTEQAEQIVSEGMLYGQSRYQSAYYALNAVAYNIAQDVASGETPTEGQLGRFAALDAIVKAEQA